MKIEDLKKLMGDGKFHHATYRSVGTLWEGLWIYQKEPDEARGFFPAGAFLKGADDFPQAEELVRGTGISVGSYGQG